MSDVDNENVAEDEQETAETEGEGEGGAGKSKFGKKKLIIMAAAGLVVLAGLGGGGAWYFGLFGGEDGTQMAERPEPKPAVFLDLPDLTVNLTSLDQRTQYLRMKISLEVSSTSDIASISPLLPRVLDTFQVYLRELRLTDLEGSAGVYRLKEELRRRVNLAVYPAEVNDILFKELLIQ